jgi:hypothetical protein
MLHVSIEYVYGKNQKFQTLKQEERTCRNHTWRVKLAMLALSLLACLVKDLARAAAKDTY